MHLGAPRCRRLHHHAPDRYNQPWYLGAIMNKQPLYILVLVALAPLFGCTALSNADTKAAAPIVQHAQTGILGGAQSFVLDNGLRVVILPQKTPAVITQIWYDVGASDEAPGKGGLAHFLEHMMFKDNETLTGSEYDRIIGHFGAQNNAFTSHNYTVYYELFAPRYYPLALKLEAARVNGLLFDAQKIQIEREVIKEERRLTSESSPYARAFEVFWQLAIPNNPHGLPVIGSMADIDALTQADLEAFYTRHYAPNNAVLVLAGDVNSDEARAKIQEHFGALKPKPLTPRVLSASPKAQGAKYQVFADTAVHTPSLYLAFLLPDFKDKDALHVDAYALDVAQSLLDGGENSLFATELVQEGIVSTIDTHYESTARGDHLFFIEATPSEGVDVDVAKDAIMAQIARLTSVDGVDKGALVRAQNMARTDFILASDSLEFKASLAGEFTLRGLSFDVVNHYPDALARVGQADIVSAVLRYLNPENSIYMPIVPKKEDAL